MVKAALWLRVSDPGQHTENQQPDLESFIARKGWEVGPVYQFQDSAWKGGHQKVLSQVYQDARLGKFDVLVVWALDRLSRQGVAATFEIVNRLGRNGARVVSVMESWTEQEGPMYDLLLSVFAWVAQYESQRRSERTKAGMARAAKLGKRLGRRAVVDTVDLDLVTQMKAEGRSWAEIHQAHPQTVNTPRGGHKRPGLGTIRRAWAACQNGHQKNEGDGVLAG